MKFEAGITESERVEAALDDLQGGHLLGDEKHLLSVAQRLRDQVGDCLRLACARRTLDDEIVPLKRVEERENLRAVCINHVVHVGRPQRLIEVGVIGEASLCLRKAIFKKCSQHVMLAWIVRVGPFPDVEVVVHQEFAEGEEAEIDGGPIDYPPCQVSHFFVYLVEIGTYLNFLCLDRHVR